jgi:hypothetical protein
MLTTTGVGAISLQGVSSEAGPIVAPRTDGVRWFDLGTTLEFRLSVLLLPLSWKEVLESD